MKYLFAGILLILLSYSSSLVAQPDSTHIALPSSVTLTGYVEAYYSYDFSNPSNHYKPSFVSTYSRHNEVNINLAYLKLNLQKENVRANLAFMTGTYALMNLAAEPGLLKNVYEANAGLKLSKKKNLWVDAGIFISHIGFESPIGKDSWTLSRSMLADNSPYYESGVKLCYTSINRKWFLSALYLNGWQRIQRPDNYNTPAFGHQVTYTPNEKITLNSSSFIGSDTPDSTHRMRYFHNFYGIFKLNNRLGLTAGFDYGMQQKQKDNDVYNIWYSPVLILRVKATERLSFAARGEYYYDESGVIIVTGTPNGFQTFSYSLNIDYLIYPNALVRLEGRLYHSKDPIFTLNEKSSTENYVINAAFAVNF